MNYYRTRAILILTFTLTLYLLTYKKNSVYTRPASQSNSFTPMKFVFEGHETGTDNLILAFLDKKSQNETMIFRMYRYKGPYESDELNYYSFHIIIDLNNSLIKNDPHNYYSTNFTYQPKSSIKLEITFKELHHLNGTIFNGNHSVLTFQLQFMDQETVYLKRLGFGLGVSVFYLVYFILLNEHYKKCEASENFAVQTSLLTLGLVQLYELVFTFWVLRKAFEKPIQAGIDFVFISAFWAFCVYIFIHMKLIVKVFLSKTQNLMEFPRYIQARIVSNFQSRCFLLIVMGMAAIKYFANYYYVTLPLLHLFFVPQIVLNSFKGYKESFSLMLIFAVLLIKAVLALYFLVNPYNIIRCKPEPVLGAVILTVLLLQAVALYLQSYKPRFLIPKKYRPVGYDYFASVSEDSQLENSENVENTCTICMTALSLSDNTNIAKIMRTPCNHLFHQDCLIPWMRIKLNCPTCRAPIPEFID